MIAIVDYEMGNLRSVQKAFERVGHEATITSDPAVLADAARIVLPGVGAFRDAIAALRDAEDAGGDLRHANAGPLSLAIVDPLVERVAKAMLNGWVDDGRQEETLLTRFLRGDASVTISVADLERGLAAVRELGE